jgi:tripartite-type tricarboxylate transporter receptor subunit TctC
VKLSTVKAIHYSGGGEQIAAVLGSHVTAGVGGVPEFASQVKSGKRWALAFSSPEHLAWPDDQKQATMLRGRRGLRSRR